jgi:hypothetical protein
MLTTSEYSEVALRYVDVSKLSFALLAITMGQTTGHVSPFHIVLQKLTAP